MNGGGGSTSKDETQSQSGTFGSTTSGTGLATTAPYNQQQIIDALGGAQNQFSKSNGDDPAHAGANLRTYGDQALGTAGYGGNYLGSVLGGNYLNKNPFLDQAYQNGAGQLEASSRSAWGGQDTLPGSSGVQQAALANAQGNLATGIYGGAYNNERNLQNQAASLIPGQVGAYTQPALAQLQGGMAPQQAWLQALSSVSPGSSLSSSRNIATSGFNNGTANSSASGGSLSGSLGARNFVGGDK